MKRIFQILSTKSRNVPSAGGHPERRERSSHALPVFYFGISILFIASCEKVIDVPLEESERRMVIEGVMRDQPGNNYVLISKTGSVYDESNFEKISGAAVTVADGSGTVYTLTEVPGEPGKYTNATLQAQADNSYSLSVLAGGETITSTCKTFFTPVLDSLFYIEQIGSFGVGSDTTYLVFFNFADQESQDNYYRVNAWINGTKEDFYYIANDDLFSGQTYTQPIYGSTVEKGDTVLIELISFDESNYTYFYSMMTATTEGPFAPTPSNPVSNLDGNAIGYFGAYTTDTMSIIIPQ
jgi:hypothetical protein